MNFTQKWRSYLLLEKTGAPDAWQVYVDLTTNRDIDRTAILVNLRAKCGVTVVRVIPGTTRQGEYNEDALIKVKFRPSGGTAGEFLFKLKEQLRKEPYSIKGLVSFNIRRRTLRKLKITEM